MRYRELGLADFGMLHGTDKKHPHGGIVVTEMTEDMDADKIRQAIGMALQRFPYLKVSLHKGFADVWFERNDADFVLAEGKTKIRWDSEESNGHLFAFSYIGNRLLLHGSHILYDGYGEAVFMRTVILHYCQLKYDKGITNPDAITTDTPMWDDELCDPLSVNIPKDTPSDSKPKLPKAFRPNWVGQFQLSKNQYLCHINISSESIDKLCQRYNVTPPVLIDVLFARAIHHVNPSITMPVISGMPASVRKLTGCEHSMLNATIPLRIVHHEGFWQKSLGEQMIDVQQQIKSQTLPSFMWNALRDMVKLFKVLRMMPDALRAFIMPKAFAKAVAINTYDISFTGRMRLGDTGKYVKSIHMDAAFKGSGMMMEMLSLDNYLCISYVQEWQNSIYLDSLFHEMTSVGLVYDSSPLQEVI